jgi:CRISPR system Cascade subunit CasA
MTYSFNFIDQPWIPCVALNGKSVELSLRQVFLGAHHLREIAGDSPLETAAIYRLLLAVLHSALRGPENKDDWHALWQTGTWDTPWLRDYLDKWKHRFDLFDPERPFYQSRDERASVKSMINLAMDMASGNNAVLFDHHTEIVGVSFSPARAARVLTTVQTFGLAGLYHPQQQLTFTDAPWSRGIVFLVEGDNLFQTLALNLMVISEDDTPIPGNPDDCPAWENEDPYQPARTIPRGYLDYLTWQNRHIFLIPEGDDKRTFVTKMMVSPGLRISTDVIDPFKHYRIDETRGRLVLRFSADRALWRDSAALFKIRNPQNTIPPKIFVKIGDLAVDKPDIKPGQQFRFMALGMANDLAKIEFFRQERFPLILEYLENADLVAGLSDVILKAEEVRNKLRFAVSWLALLILSPKSDGKNWGEVDGNSKKQAIGLSSHWGFERQYWGSLETPFLYVVETLPLQSEQAMSMWEDTLRHAAWGSLESAANQAGLTTTALKAAVRARAILGGGLKDIFPDLEKKEVPV